MAVPTAPTLVSITTEALKKAGYSNPSSVILKRAQDEWMAEIKNELLVLLGGNKMKDLYTTSIAVTTEGQGRYSNPTDYFSDMSIDLLSGSHFGTAQAGAAGSITLEADEDISATAIIGQNILVTSNTGINSMSQCVTYDEGTKVATVSPDFNTAPAANSGYMVVGAETSLIQKPIWDLAKFSMPTATGFPRYYFPLGDDNYGEFILHPVPYTSDTTVYGMRMRYYANLMTIDLTSTLMATLYQKWRGMWTQGVYAKALEGKDDKLAKDAMDTYRGMQRSLVARATYGMDLNNLRSQVVDY